MSEFIGGLIENRGIMFFYQVLRENVWLRLKTVSLFLVNLGNRNRVWIWFAKNIKHWFVVGM